MTNCVYDFSSATDKDREVGRQLFAHNPTYMYKEADLHTHSCTLSKHSKLRDGAK